MNYSRYNMPDRSDRKKFVDEIYTDKLYCDDCCYLKIHQPYKGPTTCDINPWRDSYKCECEALEEVRLYSKSKNIPRSLMCLLLDYYVPYYKDKATGK